MFSQKNFNQSFLKRLEPFFLENGYKLVLSNNQFVKKEKDKELSVTVYSTLWSYGYSLHLSLGLKFLEAEKIYKGFLKRNPNMGKAYMGIGGEIGDIIYNAGEFLEKRKSLEGLEIEKESDIEKAEQKIKEVFLSEIEPFFRKYSDIGYTEEVLNTFTDKTPKFCNNPHFRMRLGLVLAKLTKRESYEWLEREYLTMNGRDGMNETLQAEFAAFVNFLRNK